MAAYSLDNLLHLWALSKLTTEQAVGQILQVLHEFEPRLIRLEQTVTAPPRISPPPAAPPHPASTPPAPSPRKRQSRRRAG